MTNQNYTEKYPARTSRSAVLQSVAGPLELAEESDEESWQIWANGVIAAGVSRI
jgi:hypothetical protein